jgi:hypothetical protein
MTVLLTQLLPEENLTDDTVYIEARCHQRSGSEFRYTLCLLAARDGAVPDLRSRLVVAMCTPNQEKEAMCKALVLEGGSGRSRQGQ